MRNGISMYLMWRCTPVSNLTYLASPGQFFILMPNCSLGPPEYEKIFSKTNLIWAIRKCMVTMATHIVILMDVCVCVGGGGVGTYKFNHILADTYHLLPN